jgi:steroid 5-alpha reductase family enzyme
LVSVPGRARSLLICVAAYLCAAVAAAAVCRLLPGSPPALAAFLADGAATIVVFAFSLALDNSSVYDPYWSVAPVPIVLFWLLRQGSTVGARQVLVILLVAAWAARLTYNWIRRWRGLADEDWRYADYRTLGAGYWPVSFLGFHLMPTVLVFFGCLPLLPALAGTGNARLGILDLAAFLVTAGAILVEAAADRQLRRFLGSRRQPGQTLDTGLWALSRHPNYFGEVSFWWGLWLFGLAAAPSRWWTIAGPLAITALFLFVSIPMMDRRMLARHPGYAAHMTARSAFIPWRSSTRSP